MAAADTVESQLRNTVRAARTRSLRCVKAIIAKKSSNLDPDSVTYTLALANSAPDEGQSLDKEFQRCVKGLLEPEKPSFLLFRADLCENIDGSRWLLLAWLPDVVPEIDRARYVRSRGLLADLVPQPYFLSELLAREVKSLVWSSAAAALSRTRRPKEAEEDLPAKPPTLEAPQGPLRLSQAAQGLLQRLANKEDSCLKLVVIRTARQQAPQLEAKVMDCRSPSQLAKADLPSTWLELKGFGMEVLRHGARTLEK
ncbi:unnamed protein product [Effrenium voratum]|nr:unnamed protein product [Effrenium voratum]